MVIRQSNSNRNDKVCVKFRLVGLHINVYDSDDDSQRAARRIARCIQRLGYKTKFRNYRIVNCLATCSMPWPIDIVKLSQTYPECVRLEKQNRCCMCRNFYFF
jgi:hypothetical protein